MGMKYEPPNEEYLYSQKNKDSFTKKQRVFMVKYYDTPTDGNHTLCSIYIQMKYYSIISISHVMKMKYYSIISISHVMKDWIVVVHSQKKDSDGT
jgi:hypothetical protein